MRRPPRSLWVAEAQLDKSTSHRSKEQLQSKLNFLLYLWLVMDFGPQYFAVFTGITASAHYKSKWKCPDSWLFFGGCFHILSDKFYCMMRELNFCVGSLLSLAATILWVDAFTGKQTPRLTSALARRWFVYGEKKADGSWIYKGWLILFWLCTCFPASQHNKRHTDQPLCEIECVICIMEQQRLM